MDLTVETALPVNGVAFRRRVEPRQSLVDFLRSELELTGSHVGCEHGVCGACTGRGDGSLGRGCLMLAGLSGTYCRRTGYHAIVDAISKAGAARPGGRS